MEEALLARIKADSAIAAIIGTKAYWNDRKDTDGLPCVVLTKVTPGRRYTHGGADDLFDCAVQMDCLGSLPRNVWALKRALIAAIEPAATVSGVSFGQSFLQAERDMPPTDLPDGRVYRVSLDFLIFYKE